MVSILGFRMFLRLLKMVAQSIASTSSPQRETRISASMGLEVQPIAQVAFDSILFGKSSLKK